MGGKSKIEWTDTTWNPIRGCTTVSEGCRNCYAMRVAARFSQKGQPYEGLAKFSNLREPRWTNKVGFVEKHLEDPLHWKKSRRIFVNSMSDVFHESLPFSTIDDIFRVMLKASHHTYQILTKRPKRMFEYFERMKDMSLPGAILPPHIWIGVSIEDQKSADKRIPWLLNTPAAIRFLSCEPLLGKVNLEPHIDVQGENDHNLATPNWVIVGGESGAHSRPMDPMWARSIRDQCQEYKIPFFFKQWGEWGPGENVLPIDDCHKMKKTGFYSEILFRAGKKYISRELDGREWNEYPTC